MPREEREAQLVVAGTEEFGRAGYAGASMVEIARRVGVTKPLLYQYFGSKDGLYLACLHRAGGRLTDGVAVRRCDRQLRARTRCLART
ncbi:helix-turn-helix domain-containing protein, partial [Amycolatopsis mediterranei]